jgi:hypothetical protein
MNMHADARTFALPHFDRTRHTQKELRARVLQGQTGHTWAAADRCLRQLRRGRRRSDHGDHQELLRFGRRARATMACRSESSIDGLPALMAGLGARSAR